MEVRGGWGKASLSSKGLGPSQEGQICSWGRGRGQVSQAIPWLVTFHVPRLDPGFWGPCDHLMCARSISKIH